MTERVTTAVLEPDEEELDGSLRPRSLVEFVGQERVKEQLAIAYNMAGDLARQIGRTDALGDFAVKARDLMEALEQTLAQMR